MDSKDKGSRRFGWRWRRRNKADDPEVDPALPKHHVMKSKTPPVTLVVNYSQDGAAENATSTSLLAPQPVPGGNGVPAARPSVSFSTTQVAKPKRRRHAAFGSRLSLHSLFLPITPAVPAPKEQRFGP